MRFSKEVNLTDNFDETTVDIYVKPADPTALGNFNLTWVVKEITSDWIDV